MKHESEHSATRIGLRRESSQLLVGQIFAWLSRCFPLHSIVIAAYYRDSVKITVAVLLTSLFSTAAGFSQGKITFANHIPSLDAPLFGPELENPPFSDWANAKFGNTPTNTPAGSQIYNGPLLDGLIVSFWAAPGTGITDAHQLIQGNTTSLLVNGYFASTMVTFPGLPISGQATVQVRVSSGSTLWDFGEGYAAVSPLFTVNVISLGGFASGLTSFNAGWRDGLTLTPFPVPEPSSIALIGIGSALAMFARRRSDYSNMPRRFSDNVAAGVRRL